MYSVSDAAKMLNMSLKNLVTEHDDLPTPNQDSPPMSMEDVVEKMDQTLTLSGTEGPGDEEAVAETPPSPRYFICFT